MDRGRLVATGRAVVTGARRRPRWLSALSLTAGLQVALLVTTQPLTAAQEGTPAMAEAPRIMAPFTLPDIPLASLQNEALPEYPIADDRGVMLGDIIGDDLWHGPGSSPTVGPLAGLRSTARNAALSSSRSSRPSSFMSAPRMARWRSCGPSRSSTPVVSRSPDSPTWREPTRSRSISPATSRSHTTRVGSTSRGWYRPVTAAFGWPMSTGRRSSRSTPMAG